MLVLKGLVGLHGTVQLQLLSTIGWGIGLDYRDIEWFPLEMNRNHSVVFEIASKYCIGLDTTKDRISDLEAKSEEVTYNKIVQLFL